MMEQLASLFDEEEPRDVRAARENRRAARGMVKAAKASAGKRAA